MKKRLLSILLVFCMILSMMPTALAADATEVFTTQDFNIWGTSWPGAYNVGWQYVEGFDTNAITGLEVGLKDVNGDLVVKYTAEGEQLIWQKENGYFSDGGQSSAPFFKVDVNTPPALDPDGNDWTVEKGEKFAQWNIATAYVSVTTAEATYTQEYLTCAHTHDYTEETVKAAAVKVKATDESNAVYYKSCTCGAVSYSDEDTFEVGNIVRIADSEDLVAAIENQEDGQVWILTGSEYDLGDTGFTVTTPISGFTGPFAFPIYANNLTIQAAKGADVTISSSWAPKGDAWNEQNFITVSGANVTIDGVDLKGNVNTMDNECNKIIELVGGAKDFTLTNVDVLAPGEGLFGGSIYFSVADAGVTTIKNVTMAAWINANSVTAGNVAINNLTQDFSDNKYVGEDGYVLGIRGDNVTAEAVTVKVNSGEDLQKQVIDNLRDGTTIELTGDITVTADPVSENTGAINIEGEKKITINGNGYTIFADKTDNNFKDRNDGGKASKVINVVDGANVTLSDLTVDGNGVAKHGIGVTTNKTTDATLILYNVTATNSRGYGVVNNSSTITVDGLKTSGNGWGGVNADSRYSDVVTTMDDCTIEEKNSVLIQGTLGGTTEISSGSFDTVTKDATADNTVTISGGTYKTEVPEEYLADNCLPVKNDEGKFVVQESEGTVTDVTVVDSKDGVTVVTRPVPGMVLTANIVLDDGTVIGSYPVNEAAHYSWHYKGTDNVLGTDATYTVTNDNMDKVLCVTVSVDGYFGEITWEADTITLSLGSVKSVAVVGEDGFTPVTTPEAGQKLTANVTVADIRGNERVIGSYPVDETVTYFWHYEGSDTSLGSDPTFTVTNDNIGKTLCLDISAEGYTGSASWEADASVPFGAVTSVAVVDGEDGCTPVTAPVAGQKLLANITVTGADGNDTVIGGYPVNENATYKWYTANNPDVVIGTDPYYTVTTEDVKEILCVEVSVDGYTGTATWEAATAVTIPAVGVALNKNKATIALGKTETLIATVTPADTTEALSWTTSDSAVATVEGGVVTAKGLGTAIITAKVGKHTASCVVTVGCDFDENCPSKIAYTDVNMGDWYHIPVDYVTANGIMQGIGDKLFAPDMDLTRAQLVQILYNMEGKPAYTAGKTFSDVTSKGDWYYDAIMWAASEGVVNGYEDGTFQPDRKISRQEMVTIMFNYGKDELPVSGVDADTLKDFPDADKTWAEDAFAWAVSYEIVNGKDGKLAPEDTARRAEAAKIIMVFCNKADFGA